MALELLSSLLNGSQIGFKMISLRGDGEQDMVSPWSWQLILAFATATLVFNSRLLEHKGVMVKVRLPDNHNDQCRATHGMRTADNPYPISVVIGVPRTHPMRSPTKPIWDGRKQFLDTHQPILICWRFTRHRISPFQTQVPF